MKILRNEIDFIRSEKKMNDKKVGRPKGKIFPVRKELLITPELEKNWNPGKIRIFLKGDFEILYNIMVKKMEPIVPLTPEEIESLETLKEVFK